MPRNPPSYRLHSTGQATVRLNGHDYYLGVYGSLESRAEYDRLIAIWLANGRKMPAEKRADLTVTELTVAYLAWAESYYRKPDPEAGSNRPGSQVSRIKTAFKPLRKLYGSTAACSFGPMAFKAVRAALIPSHCRTQINLLMDCVRRCFKWAVAEELLPASSYEALRAVTGLRAGRSEAREREPVKPVPQASIDAVKAVVTRHIRAMIDLQLLTGARPGEVLSMRPADVDRSGAVWIYRPRRHKTQLRGRTREIYLGPKAQAVLSPFLLRDGDSYCFSPREASEEYRRERGWSLRGITKHKRYQIASYAQIVRQACGRARVTPWFPAQLRHNAASSIVAEFGWEAARIILGHATLNTTRIYGEDHVQKALDVIGKVG